MTSDETNSGRQAACFGNWQSDKGVKVGECVGYRRYKPSRPLHYQISNCHKVVPADLGATSPRSWI